MDVNWKPLIGFSMALYIEKQSDSKSYRIANLRQRYVSMADLYRNSIDINTLESLKIIRKALRNRAIFIASIQKTEGGE